MTKTILYLNKNGTEEIQTVEMFSQNEKGLLYSAIAMGAIFGSALIVTFVQKFGARFTFTCYGLISAFCTLLSPLTANQGFLSFFVIRIIQGFGTSVTFASIGYVSSAWFPLESSGLFLSLLTTYVQLAPLFTMPTSGEFCISKSGWPGVYYLHGILTIICFALFYLVYRDSPRDHCYVSDIELAQIEKSKSTASFNSENLKIPYFQMISDQVIIGILFACF
uniref:Major facilitator superfamily (MFS) profile domain-containing protein n=1 Tax=Panagrolaimus sp. PS1159 TaxID=55785 RepID=A0AC35F1A9_9BILA